MNGVLQQIMNMVENTWTVPSVSGFSMIGFTVLLILGAVPCVLGYRLLRFWMMLFGFIIGAGIGFVMAYSSGVTEKYMYAAFMVGAGVILAVIAFVSYKIGIFILGAGIGIGLGIYVFHPTTSLVFFFCLLLGVGLGVLAMKQAREVVVIGTSLLGGVMSGFSAARLGGLADIPYGLGLSAGFALLGMLIQFATNRGRDDDEYEYEYEEENDDPENSSDYLDFRDYMPQKSDKREKEEMKKVRRQSQSENVKKSSVQRPDGFRKVSHSQNERQVDFKLEKSETRKHRGDDVAPESEKTVPYRPRRSKKREIDLPLESFDTEDSCHPMNEENEESVVIDEDKLDEEVLREMMEEDDREGQELWKRISRRDDVHKKRRN